MAANGSRKMMNFDISSAARYDARVNYRVSMTAPEAGIHDTAILVEQFLLRL